MITAEEAEQIGLVNKVVSLEPKDDILPEETMKTTTNSSKEQEKKRVNELARILNKKLMEECLLFAKGIKKNSVSAVKTSKILINKGMDTDIDTGLRLEIYGWALCFSHEDRKKMMSAFLNKEKN
jgi:3-hydroxypropionyl-coenzyme A dehydratase